MRIPTRLDRYPAKMVWHLADRLIDRYATADDRLLDPFCGSGAILKSAHHRGIEVSGVDVNPVAALFCHVKLRGFSSVCARKLAIDVIQSARNNQNPFHVEWPSKDYWFTPATIAKFESLRAACRDFNLAESDDGKAILLSFALSVRTCSKADQRSPKPFISRQAITSRKGKHFDPYSTLLSTLDELSVLYGRRTKHSSFQFDLADLASDSTIPDRIGKHSIVVTSPPYINAQDYFRNFKLELYLLEGVLPFHVNDLRERFVGTERGKLLMRIPTHLLNTHYAILPSLKEMDQNNPRLSAVVHRYLYDMGSAFDNIRNCLTANAKLVLVCGDNLIGGIQIQTWRILREMLEEKGFKLFESFSDPIKDRVLAPKRCGHKGLIKEEVICAFRLT